MIYFSICVNGVCILGSASRRFHCIQYAVSVQNETGHYWRLVSYIDKFKCLRTSIHTYQFHAHCNNNNNNNSHHRIWVCLVISLWSRNDLARTYEIYLLSYSYGVSYYGVRDWFAKNFGNSHISVYV